ncbi:MAG: hypothetical protein OXH68_12250 [Gammaproteobacteria bacterium]|nr:hypothetical protein [Gammaproteobacteria bacterium]
MDESSTSAAQTPSGAEPVATMATAVEGLMHLLDGKPTLAAARGIPDAALDSIYGVGRELYANGHHREALPSFEALCLYDHADPRNWQALGLCRQALGDYAGAAEALAFAVGQHDGLDVALQLHLVECLLAAAAFEAAATALLPLAAADLDSASAAKVRVLATRLERVTTGDQA